MQINDMYRIDGAIPKKMKKGGREEKKREERWAE
jgi:hypothetical protein